MTITILWTIFCVAGAALSVRSVAILRGRAPATSLGWVASLVYFAIAGISAARQTRAPALAEDLALGVLVVAFVIAGVRDEPQAEPWWWPNRVGETGRERRERGRK